MTATQPNSRPKHKNRVNYSVLVEQQPDQSWLVTTLNRLECQAKGSTREEALQRLQQAIEQRLSSGEVIQMEVEVPALAHSWLELAGKYENDPMFAEMMAEVERERREEFAQLWGDDPAQPQSEDQLPC